MPGMITLDDCVALCGLSEEEILAIAEHEHIPEMAATALASYLAQSERGLQQIGTMIIDDIRAAQETGDKEQVRVLLHCLHHYLKKHPEAGPTCHPWSRIR